MAQETGGRSLHGQCHVEGVWPGATSEPTTEAESGDRCLREAPPVSERRACRVVGQSRSSQRHYFQGSDEKERLVVRIIELVTRYRRYEYRRIAAFFCGRIWRPKGLKVPQKQPKRGRLRFNDGSCIRLRP